MNQTPGEQKQPVARIRAAMTSLGMQDWECAESTRPELFNLHVFRPTHVQTTMQRFVTEIRRIKRNIAKLAHVLMSALQHDTEHDDAFQKILDNIKSVFHGMVSLTANMDKLYVVVSLASKHEWALKDFVQFYATCQKTICSFAAMVEQVTVLAMFAYKLKSTTLSIEMVTVCFTQTGALEVDTRRIMDSFQLKTPAELML